MWFLIKRGILIDIWSSLDIRSYCAHKRNCVPFCRVVYTESVADNKEKHSIFWNCLILNLIQYNTRAHISLYYFRICLSCRGRKRYVAVITNAHRILPALPYERAVWIPNKHDCRCKRGKGIMPISMWYWCHCSNSKYVHRMNLLQFKTFYIIGYRNSLLRAVARVHWTVHTYWNRWRDGLYDHLCNRTSITKQHQHEER